MIITIDQVMILGPCAYYPRKKILEISGGRTEIEVTELSNLDMPVSALIWIAGRLLPTSDICMIAAAFAESILHLFEMRYPNNFRPRNAIQIARLYAMGEISSVAAAAAAYDDAYAVAYDAYAVAYDAYDAYAYSAYSAAAAAAAADAAYYAAYAVADAAYYAAYAVADAARAAAYAARAAYSAAAAAAYAADAAAEEKQKQREIIGLYLQEL